MCIRDRSTTVYLRRRAARAESLLNDADPTTNPTPAAEIAAVAVHSVGDAARTLAAAAKARRAAPSQAKPATDAAVRGTGGTGKNGARAGAKHKPGGRSAHRPPKPRHG